MNVSELFELTHWITLEIENKQIAKKYQALQTILHTHSQPNQQKVPFESQKEELIDSLSKVPLGQLTRDQLDFLHHLGISDYVGEKGVEFVNDTLYINVIDVATSAQNIAQVIQEINGGVGKSTQLKSGLTGCVTEEEYETDHEILMRVSFTGNALMSNVTDFKNWGSTWYDIGRGIAMVHNASPEEVKVVGATKGSIIIELAVIASIATTTSVIILSALKVAEKVQSMMIQAEVLRGLKLKNGKLANELEKEAQIEKKAGIDEITAEVIKTLKIKTKEEGDKKVALGSSVKKLVDFIEKGGIVDFIIPEDKEGEENKNEELRIAFQEIRKLEKKLALIEYDVTSQNS